MFSRIGSIRCEQGRAFFYLEIEGKTTRRDGRFLKGNFLGTEIDDYYSVINVYLV